jgi:hypothetical protein
VAFVTWCQTSFSGAAAEGCHADGEAQLSLLRGVLASCGKSAACEIPQFQIHQALVLFRRDSSEKTQTYRCLKHNLISVVQVPKVWCKFQSIEFGN